MIAIVATRKMQTNALIISFIPKEATTPHKPISQIFDEPSTFVMSIFQSHAVIHTSYKSLPYSSHSYNPHSHTHLAAQYLGCH